MCLFYFNFTIYSERSSHHRRAPPCISKWTLVHSQEDKTHRYTPFPHPSEKSTHFSIPCVESCKISSQVNQCHKVHPLNWHQISGIRERDREKKRTIALIQQFIVLTGDFFLISTDISLTFRQAQV